MLLINFVFVLAASLAFGNPPSDAVSGWNTQVFKNHIDSNDPLRTGSYKTLVGIYQDCSVGEYRVGCRRDQHDARFQHCLKSQRPIQGLGRVPTSVSGGGAQYPPRKIVCDPGRASCYSNSHPFQQHVRAEQVRRQASKQQLPKSCQPENAVPGCFGFGAKPIVSNGVMTNNHGLDNHLSASAGIMGSPGEERCRAYDCAGFVGALIYHSGMKVWKGNTEKRLAKFNYQYRTTTHHFESMHKGAYGKDACLQPTTIGADGSVGSFVFGRGGDHSMVIHPKGNDPLGIQRAMKRGNCNSISAEHMDLEVVQSASLHDTIYASMGPARMHWNAHSCGRQKWRTKRGDDTYYNYVEQDENGVSRIHANKVDQRRCFAPRQQRTTHHLVYVRFRNAMENIARQACFDIAQNKRPVAMKSVIDSYQTRRRSFWDRVRFWDRAEEQNNRGTLDRYPPDDKGGYFALSPKTSDKDCQLPEKGTKSNPLHRKGQGCAEECLARESATS